MFSIIDSGTHQCSFDLLTVYWISPTRSLSWCHWCLIYSSGCVLNVLWKLLGKVKGLICWFQGRTRRDLRLLLIVYIGLRWKQLGFHLICRFLAWKLLIFDWNLLYISFSRSNLRLDFCQSGIYTWSSWCRRSFRKASGLLLVIDWQKACHIQFCIIIRFWSLRWHWYVIELLLNLLICQFHTLLAFLSLVKLMELCIISWTWWPYHPSCSRLMIIFQVFFVRVKHSMLECWLNKLVIFL